GRMEKELQMAKDIQRGLLPTELPTRPGYEIAADWRSAREVAGDFYDCFELGDSDLGVIVADVSDKGAPAALFMAVARSLIRGTATSSEKPAEALQRANKTILTDTQSGMFVTVYYTVLHPGGAITGINAGHNRPLLYRTSQQTHEFLPRGGRPLGWFDDLPVEAVDYQLNPGDVLVFYTDGLTEAENIAQEPYGEDRLVEIVRANAGQPASTIMKHITASVIQFMGAAPPFDDTTLVVVRYTG
ncbi:MAG: PP2C family protein-serine/threonine phosphatase, partial [Anaerolineae bacterium]|nr:PP2C family protein-serine/threonine phosphatase [Anaerolineae bacterium]